MYERLQVLNSAESAQTPYAVGRYREEIPRNEAVKKVGNKNNLVVE